MVFLSPPASTLVLADSSAQTVLSLVGTELAFILTVWLWNLTLLRVRTSNLPAVQLMYHNDIWSCIFIGHMTNGECMEPLLCWGQQHPQEIHGLPHHHQLATSRTSSLWTYGHNQPCSSGVGRCFPRVVKVAVAPRKTLMDCQLRMKLKFSRKSKNLWRSAPKLASES